MPLASVSNAQRAPISNANFAATIHHGLPLNLFRPNLAAKGGYLSLLGRISPDMRVDRAVAIAQAANLPLKIAAQDRWCGSSPCPQRDSTIAWPTCRIHRRDRRDHKGSVSWRLPRTPFPR